MMQVMANLLAPLALSVGLNDPAIYDRLQFEGFLRPGAITPANQLAQATIGYETKDVGIGLTGLSSLNRRLTGGSASVTIPFKDYRLFAQGVFFNPQAGRSVVGLGIGAGVSHEEMFGPIDVEMKANADSSGYLGAGLHAKAQHLHWLGEASVEASRKANENRGRAMLEISRMHDDWLEFGAGVGYGTYGLEGLLRTEVNPLSHIKVKAQVSGNEGRYWIATVGLDWNTEGRFDKDALDSNKYIRKQARMEKMYKSEAKKIRRSLTAEKEKLKEQLGQQTEKEKRELSELVSDARAAWGNYKRTVPEEDMVEACRLWREVSLLDSENKGLKRFINSTTEKRYSHMEKSGYYMKGVRTYSEDNLSSSIEYFRKVLLLLTGSEDGDVSLVSSDPRLRIITSKDNIEKILKKQRALENLGTPTAIHAAPTSVSQTAK